MVVNYDLPWAIIRLIQRVGRVDRIGQRAETLLCYSFLPADGVERIIRLRSRVRQRLRENAEVVGTDERFFDDDEDDGLLFDLYNEKSGLLDGEGDSEVDLASHAYQIWRNAIEADPSLEKKVTELPDVVYSTRSHTPAHAGPPGVLLYLRTADDNDFLAWVDGEGQSVTQSQLAILDAAQCEPDTPALPRQEAHHELVRKGVELIAERKRSGAGALGRPSGARFRTYERLKRYVRSVKGTLFDLAELHRAIDEIYRFPLRPRRRTRSTASSAPASPTTTSSASCSLCARKTGSASSGKTSPIRSRGSSARSGSAHPLRGDSLAKLNAQRTREILQAFDFQRLFVEELGWSKPARPQAPPLERQGAGLLGARDRPPGWRGGPRAHRRATARSRKPRPGSTSIARWPRSITSTSSSSSTASAPRACSPGPSARARSSPRAAIPSSRASRATSSSPSCPRWWWISPTSPSRATPRSPRSPPACGKRSTSSGSPSASTTNSRSSTSSSWSASRGSRASATAAGTPRSCSTG